MSRLKTFFTDVDYDSHGIVRVLLAEEEEEKRLAARELAEKKAQEKRAAEQAAFCLKSETERKRRLKAEEERIAEERARIPVVVSRGSPRVSPNIAIASGGAKDVMDVTWAYSYLSRQPHLFLAMKVLPDSTGMPREAMKFAPPVTNAPSFAESPLAAPQLA